MGYLVDSNVLIDYLSNRFTEKQLNYLDVIFNELLIISIITKIEIFGFNNNADEEFKMQLLLNGTQVIMLSTKIADRTIKLKKFIKIKTPDAIIAATALEAGLTLITNNTADFKRIQGLEILNPYNL